MPGPVSDSYDPEFSTSSNAQAVRDGIEETKEIIDTALGKSLKNIVDVAYGEDGDSYGVSFTERQLRIIRFCLNRALESI
jgi:hypothetical protein